MYEWQRDTMTRLTFGAGRSHRSGLESRRPLHRFSEDRRHLLDPLRRRGQAPTADSSKNRSDSIFLHAGRKRLAFMNRDGTGRFRILDRAYRKRRYGAAGR